MRKILVSALRPGMIVGKAVYGADRQMYLNKGVALKAAYITGLARAGITAIYVDDPLLGDVLVQEVVTEETRQQAVGVLKNTIQNYKNAQNGSVILLHAKLQSIVEKMITEVLANKEIIVNLSDIRIADDYTFYHSVNVCVLSLLTAAGRGMSRRKLEELSIGALLHDLGKVLVNGCILKKRGSLAPEEFEETKKHPGFGYEILAAQKNISKPTGMVVVQHHERCDGSGYPYNLTYDKIHPFARLVMVVDVYDALTADRPYRSAFKPHEAIGIITKDRKMYDAEMVSSLFKHLAAYPVGTAVRLNNGELAIVVQNNKGETFRPVVRICKKSDGYLYGQPQDVNLANRGDLLITEVLDDNAREEELPLTAG